MMRRVQLIVQLDQLVGTVMDRNVSKLHRAQCQFQSLKLKSVPVPFHMFHMIHMLQCN